MNYLSFVCTDPEAEPYDPAQDNIQQWVSEFQGKGWLKDGMRLREPREASTIRIRNGRPLVVDGPFAETKEGIAGFDLYDCPNLDAAIEIASKHPMARFGRIELRPVRPFDLPGLPAPAPAPAGSQNYFQFVIADPSAPPNAANLAPLTAWLTKYSLAGVYRSGDRLAGVESATTVRVRQGKVVVTDGPFAETKEVIGGYAILACRSKDEAIQVSLEHPMASQGTIEVRAYWPFE